MTRAVGRGQWRLLLLVASLLMTACGGGTIDAAPSAKEGSPSAPGGRLELGFGEALDALAASGIAAYDEPDDTSAIREPTEPVSPFGLIRFQVENLARDASAGGGVAADEIDELIPMPEDAVPFSYIVAGYVATASTPGGALARELMAGQGFERPDGLWYPTIVLALFVGEVTAVAAASEPDRAVAPSEPTVEAALMSGPAGRTVAGSGIRLAAFDPCGDFSSFFGRVLGAVAGAIGNVVSSIPLVGAAIEWALTEGLGMAADAVSRLMAELPWLTVVREGVAMLALGATVVAALRDWVVPVTATPGIAHHSVAATVSHATLSARIDDGPGDLFSRPVRNCAELLRIPLPQGGAVGSAVEWRILDGAFHMAPGFEHDKIVGETKVVRFAFDMVDELERIHQGGGPIVNSPVRVQIIVHRQDVAQVERLIRGFITSAIPDVVWTAITSWFGDPVRTLTSWTDPRSVGLVVAEYHGDPRPTPTPSEEPTPSPQPTSDPDAFCKRWRAYIDWARIKDQAGAELDRELAREIVIQFHGMRPYAPTAMERHVDAVISVYSTYADAPEPIQVPLSGREAEAMYEALLTIDAHCGTDAFQ